MDATIKAAAHRLFGTGPPEEISPDQFSERIDAFMGEVFADYTRQNPDWFVETVGEIIRDGVVSLRKHLEDPKRPDATWESPFAELQYEIEWNWERETIVTGHFEEDDFKNLEVIADKAVRTLLEHRNVCVLEQLTRRAIYYKRGNDYEPVLPKKWQWPTAAEPLTLADCLEKLDEGFGENLSLEDLNAPIPPVDSEVRLKNLSQEDRQKFLDIVFQPVSIGGFETDLSVESVSGVPPRSSSKISEKYLRKVKDLPRFQFKGSVDGPPFTAELGVAFHPLVVDFHKHRAYFPLVLGIAFEPSGETEDGEPLFSNPAEWNDEQREEFWRALLEHWGTGEEEGPEVPPLPEPNVVLAKDMTFPLAFGLTTVDANVQAFVSNLHEIRFPVKKWRTLPKWEDLVFEEIQRIKNEEGEDAFADLRQTTRSPGARGKLLKKRYQARKDPQGTPLKNFNGKPIMEEVLQLTSEAERRLKIGHVGRKGYRHIHEKDAKEYLVRVFQVGGGFIEVGLSWRDMAGPWVEEWRKEIDEQTQSLKDPKGQLSLFEDLTRKQQRQIARRLELARSFKTGHRILEVAIGQIGIQGQNPVKIPARAMRDLLKLWRDPNWKQTVEGALDSLLACDFRAESFEYTPKVNIHGHAIGEWDYLGAGRGSHGEGDYFLDVQPGFLGCLSAFESDKRKLSSGREFTVYNLRQKITEGDREKWGWGSKKKDGSVATSRKAKSSWIRFDAGRPFYNAAEGFTPEQEKLHCFVEREITLNKDPAARKRKGVQIDSKKEGANKPRLYGRDFCPLLPEQKLYQGSLGHHRRNPETGRTLWGSRTRASASGGAHSEGLIGEMGRRLLPGLAHAKRTKVIRETLQDFKAVVEEYLGGIVAARLKDKEADCWLTLKEAGDLQEADLRKACWCFFLPNDWRQKRTRKWEERKKEEAEQGGAPFAWKATSSQEEAEKAQEALRGQLDEKTETPIRELLRRKREELGLSQKQVGDLFRVSKMTLSHWERGPEPAEDGKVRGKPIPREVALLLQRWIETGEAPSSEELASRKTSRSGKKFSE